MSPVPDKVKSIVTDPQSPISSIEEARKVEERVAIPAKIVYEAIRLEGEDELERPVAALAWSGLAAGLSMGFSLLAEAVLHAYLPASHWSPLLSRFGYCTGFLIVVLGRQQLFTENTLTVVLPFLVHKDLATLRKVFRLWSTVLSANIFGTFLFALAVARIPFLDPAVQLSMLEVSQPHVGLGFAATFLRAIFSGWLIALMVWMLPDAATSRVFVIVALTYLIAIADLTHIVAGSANVFFLVVVGKLPFLSYFTSFFFPTLLGNVLGGVSLVSALAHGQVAAGKK